MSESSNARGQGIVRQMARRERNILSHQERQSAGADIIHKTFPDSVGLTVSDNGGPKIVSDVYISIVFWGKEWVRVAPPPPAATTPSSR